MRNRGKIKVWKGPNFMEKSDYFPQIKTVRERKDFGYNRIDEYRNLTKIATRMKIFSVVEKKEKKSSKEGLINLMRSELTKSESQKLINKSQNISKLFGNFSLHNLNLLEINSSNEQSRIRNNSTNFENEKCFYDSTSLAQSSNHIVKVKHLEVNKKHLIMLKPYKSKYYSVDVGDKKPPLQLIVFQCKNDSLQLYFSNKTKYPGPFNYIQCINTVTSNKKYQITLFEKYFSSDTVYFGAFSENCEQFYIFLYFGELKNERKDHIKNSGLLANLSGNKIDFRHFSNQIQDFLRNNDERNKAIDNANEIIGRRMQRNFNLFGKKNIIEKNKNVKNSFDEFLFNRTSNEKQTTERIFAAKTKKNKLIKMRIIKNEAYLHINEMIKMRV